MQKYKRSCPVAQTSEILAERWTPLIVRELILGSHRFNEIERGLPGISRSLLASRLRELEDAGVVERVPGAEPKVSEYHLSEAGRALKAVIETLGAWGVRWAFGEPRPEELDAGLRSGRFTSGCIASCCRSGGRWSNSISPGRADGGYGCCSSPGRSRCASPRQGSNRIWSSGRTRPSSIGSGSGHMEYEAALGGGAVVVEGLPALAKQLPGG